MEKLARAATATATTTAADSYRRIPHLGAFAHILLLDPSSTVNAGVENGAVWRRSG